MVNEIEDKRTNADILRTLLDPPKRRGRIRIVERPHLQPRRCAITGRHSGNLFLDLGFDTGDFMGQVYLHEDIGLEICKLLNHIPKDEYIEQLKINAELIEIAIELQRRTTELEIELDRLRSLPNSSTDPQRISDISSRISDESKRVAPTADNSTGALREKGSNKQDSEQGLANIFSSKSTI
jgi:hypothetical protein